jgi:hypothetical protein
MHAHPLARVLIALNQRLAAQLSCLHSRRHQFDIASRHMVGEAVTSAPAGVDRGMLARRLNAVRRELLLAEPHDLSERLAHVALDAHGAVEDMVVSFMERISALLAENVDSSDS